MNIVPSEREDICQASGMDLELPPEMPNGLGGDDDDEEEDEDDDRDGLDDSYDLTGTAMPLCFYIR